MADYAAMHLARQLLPHVTEPRAAATLFERAKIDDPVRCAVALNDVSAGCAKEGWAKAATEARNSSDPERLSALARFSSIQVRREVAGNVHTSPEDVRYLLGVAMKKDDEAIYTGVIAHLAPEELLETLSGNTKAATGNFPWRTLAERTRDIDVRSTIETVWLSGRLILTGYLAEALNTEPASSVSLVDLVELLPEDQRLPVLRRAWGSMSRFGIEAAQVLVENFDDIVTYSGASQFTSRGATDEAAEMLAYQDELTLRSIASRATNLKSETIDRLIASDSSDVWHQLVIRQLDNLSSSQTHQLADRVGSDPELTVPAQRMLIHSRYVLDTPQRLALLRNGDVALTTAWLEGKYERQLPREGEPAALIGSPGRAFAPEIRYHYRNSPTPRNNWPADLADVADASCSYWPAWLEKPWADEIVVAFAEQFLPHISRAGEDAYRWLAAKLSEELVDEPAVWQLFINLSGEWTGTFAQLIDAAYELSGVARETDAAPDTTGDEGCAETQLTLL